MSALVEKLAGIYADVERFAKTKAITGQGPSFKYTPIEDLADELRKAMGAAGIVMVPSRVDVLTNGEAGVTKGGATRWRAVVQVQWDLTDGQDHLTVTSIGEAIDTGDKSFNKAQTASRKYALIGAFQLSTGEDTDRQHPDPEDRAARPTAAARARELLATAGKANQKALVDGLAEAGIKSADLMDERKWEAAQAIALLVANGAVPDGKEEA